MRRTAGIAAAVAVLAAACGGPSDVIDPFPIAVDLTSASGAVVAAADTGGAAYPIVVDTLSPITAVAPAGSGAAAGSTDRRVVDVTLHAVTAAGKPSVARARFPATTVYQLSPCGGGASSCVVGTGTATLPVSGILGADALEGSAVQFDFATQTMRLFPDIAGTSATLAKNCDAVLSTPFSGGGTLEVDGTEVSFSGLRPVFGACAQFSQIADPNTPRGVDLLLVLSTAVGPTVISESAYERYSNFAGAPALADLPTTTLAFASGSAQVHIGHIDQLSLVGDASNQRGPCTEVYANRVMRADACEDPKSGVTTCPCQQGNKFCRTAAAVDLSPPPPGFEIAVLPDDNPVLAGLRNELNPDQSDVDGILGTSALASVRVSLDYPNNRIVLHCLDATECVASPAITSRSQRQDILACPAPPGSSSFQ